MALSIILSSIGKTGHPALAQLEQLYAQRIQRPWKVELRYVRKQVDWEHFLTTTSGLIIACTEQGQLYNSQQFAAKLSDLAGQYQQCIFMLGDASGIPSPLLQHAHQNWSLSPLTFPHELARVILLEQLYRAQTIVRGHPYHK